MGESTVLRVAITATFLALCVVVVALFVAAWAVAAPAPSRPSTSLIEQPPAPPMFRACEPQLQGGRVAALRCCRQLTLRRDRVCITLPIPRRPIDI